MNGGRADERGQTAIDFVVGMGVFLLAVAFVFAFVPSMFAPFFAPGIGDPVTADRAANYLAEDRLAVDDGVTGELDRDDVKDLLEACDEDELQSVLGIELRNVQVELYAVDEEDPSYSCGPDPGGSVTVSERLVSLDGELKTLYVRVW